MMIRPIRPIIAACLVVASVAVVSPIFAQSGTALLDEGSRWSVTDQRMSRDRLLRLNELERENAELRDALNKSRDAAARRLEAVERLRARQGGSSDVREALQRRDERIQNLQKQAERLRARLQNDRTSELRDRVVALTETVERLRAERDDAIIAGDAAQTQADNVSVALQNVRGRLDFLRSEAQDANRALEDMRDKLQQREARIERMRELVAIGGVDELRERVAAQDASIERLREQARRLRARRETAEERAAAAERAAGELSAGLDKATGQVGFLRREAQDANAALESMRARVSQQEERITRLRNQVGTAASNAEANADLAQIVEDQKVRIDRQQERIRRLRARNARLQELVDRLD
ncbi:MAG: hypothetical protein AAF692_05710 [Pseudomonadota bacterium]